MNLSDESIPENIGGYDVRAKINRVGPIVWTDAQRRADGARITSFESPETSALPPELTAHQTNLLGLGAIAAVLEEFILPELRQRLGQAISLDQVMSSPELVRKAFVIIPPEGGPVIYLDGEADRVEVPHGNGFARLSRDGYRWRLEAGWLPQFPDHVRLGVDRAVDALATAILQGDEQKATDLARLWFPATWESNPLPVQSQLRNEVYVLLFGIWNRAHQHFSPDSSPLDTVSHGFPAAVSQLQHDYSLEAIKAEASELEPRERLRLQDKLNDLELLFDKARLTDQELQVVRLELAVGYRCEHWTASDGEKFLRKGTRTYAATLNRARTKLALPAGPSSAPYAKLLHVIFGNIPK